MSARLTRQLVTIVERRLCFENTIRSIRIVITGKGRPVPEKAIVFVTPNPSADQFFQTLRFSSRPLFELFPIYNNNFKNSCFILNDIYKIHRSNFLIISRNVTIYERNIFTHFYRKFCFCFLRFVDQKWNRRPQQENTCCIVRCGSWKKKLVMKKEFVYTRALQKASLLLLWLIAHQEIPGSGNDLLFHFWPRMSRWGAVIRKTSF